MATKKKPAIKNAEQATTPLQGEVMPRDAEQPATQIAAYNQTAAALAEMRQLYAGKTYDVATTAGMKDAVAARGALKSTRLKLESLRVELKAPLLQQGKLLDSEAEKIRLEIVALENPIDAQIKAQELVKEQEREAREEARRQARIRITARITAIRELPFGLLNADMPALAAGLDQLSVYDATDMDDMDKQEAERAIAASRSAVQRLIDVKREQQEEDERQARQRAALARQQEEQDERGRVAQAARDKADAEAKAERDRQAAEQKAKDDAAAEERRQQQQAEDEQRERDAQARREADERHIAGVSLFDAATEAAEFLFSLGQAEDIITLALQSALVRYAQGAK